MSATVKYSTTLLEAPLVVADLRVRSPPLTAMGDASLTSVDGALEGHGRAPSFSLAQHNLDDMADPIDSALYVPFFSLWISHDCYSSLTRIAICCGG
jgi:hypothetical protein